MRFIYGSLFVALFTCFYSITFAQTGLSAINGSVYLQNAIAADAATVILLNRKDSSVVSSALVNAKGAYGFSNVKPGTYLLLTTRLGYQKNYSPDVIVTASQTIKVPAIILQPESKELKEVTVVAKTPFIEVKPGKMIINPQASITADGKSALDILKQSPGVRVDNNENVSLSGRQHALVLIDGKATNLTGADLASLLKSTQGNTIERMEVISGGSAKYDASAGGIINIVLKKGKNIGTNGTISLGAGYGRYYKSNAGINFNSRSKYLNIYGNYTFTDNKTYRDIFIDRQISYAGLTSNYNSVYRNIQKSVLNNYRLGADVLLSPNHSVGFMVHGFFNDYTFKKNNRLNIINGGSLDSVIMANSSIDRSLRNINYNISYSGTLDKAGKTLSASLTYSPYTRHNNEYINNKFYNAAGAMYRDSLLLQNLSPSHRYNWTGLVNFSSPLGKVAKLDAGAKFSYSKSDNNLIFGPLVNGVYTVSPTFSNNFIYTERVSAAFVNYTGSFGKFDMEAGLRGEYTQSKGTSININLVTPYNYFNLFPTLMLNYRHNDKNEYAISFSRGLERPNYDNLNPFLVYVDPYNFQSGNPFLRPEYNNSIRLTHTYNKDISTSVYTNFITNGNFPYYLQNDSTKTNLSTRLNLGKAYVYGISFNSPVSFYTWWNAMFNIDYSYQRYVVYPQYGNFKKSASDLIITSSQNFFINKTLALEISGKYESSTVYGINQFRPSYFVNAGISKQVFNKLGKLTLNFADIFNTLRDRAYTDYQNLNMRLYDKTETQYIRLDFTYRFGKASVKAASKHATGNENEQIRMRQ
jgi:iron complex outermembrane receptor protein